MFAQGSQTSINIVVFMPNSETERKAVDQLKAFRTMNQNLKNMGNVNFFVIEDPAIASKFGLDTSKPGDLYLIKQSDTAYRSRSAKSRLSHFSLFGFPFTSETILPAEQAKDFATSMKAVYQLTLS